MLMRLEGIGHTLGLPYLPVTPTFPLLGPFGLLPAPTKWTISFGPPIPPDLASPDDAVMVGRIAERVRATIQRLLDTTLAERKSVFLG